MSSDPFYYHVMLLLEDNGYGTPGVDLFGGEWGAGVDEQVLCLEGIGTPADLTELFEQPSVQILVRGTRPAQTGSRDIDVYRRAKAISDFLLSQLDTLDINGISYKGFEEGSNIAPLGKDENERFVYSMNFYTWRNR